MDDVNDYLGIPWKLGGLDRSGCDCWGLTLMVCKNCYGVEIPIFHGSSAEGEELAEIIKTETSCTSWQRVPTPHPGDVCIMRNDDDNHIGVYVGSNSVIHSFGKDSKGASAITRTKALQKLFRPLEFYRYAGNYNHTL